MTEEKGTYKIEYLVTGHIFIIPKDVAEALLEQFKDEYKLLEVYK